jgi:hypothetical protein
MYFWNFLTYYIPFSVNYHVFFMPYSPGLSECLYNYYFEISIGKLFLSFVKLISGNLSSPFLLLFHLTLYIVHHILDIPATSLSLIRATFYKCYPSLISLVEILNNSQTFVLVRFCCLIGN